MLRYRIFYILTLSAAFLFYLFFSGYLSFFILAATVLLPLVSWAITIFAIRKTDIRVEVESPYANKDDDIIFSIVIKNHSIFPVARAELKFCCENCLCGEKRYETLLLPVSSGPEQTAQYCMRSRFCGKITVNLTRVKYYDYLGIFAVAQRPDLHAEVFVAPKVHFLDTQIDTQANSGTESSTYSKTKPGDDPSEIFDIRPFRSGDRLRKIHWKLSSKLDELMVKEFSLPTDSSVLLLIELMAPDMAALDAVVETLASFSQFLLENEINHHVEWYHAEHQLFQEDTIETDEDLAVLLNTVLSSKRYQDKSWALACHNELSNAAREYPHVIYITGQLSDTLITFCDQRSGSAKTTVLYCGQMDESQQKLTSTLNSLDIKVVKISSDRIQESLSGLMI